jgi:hypothetical protein
MWVVFLAALAVAQWPAVAGALTATPSATATPRVIDIHGRVYDVTQGTDAGIAGARIEYVQADVRESRVSDAAGEFVFTLTIPDGATLPVWVTADGFVPELQTFRAGDVRQAGTLAIGLQPAGPRLDTFIYGRVYDAAAGLEARLANAQIEYQYRGSGVYPDASGTLITDSNGLYALRLPLGAGDVVEFTVDAPGYATLRPTIGALQLIGQEPINFGLAPLGGVLQIDPPAGTFNCTGSFDITLSNAAPPGETLVILGIALHHGYSQGDYGTAFTWDVSHIDFPLSLQSGEHVSIPVSYSSFEQQYPSRLHLDVTSGARSVIGGGIYRATMNDCPSTPTPRSTSTATPTATPTLPRTGELGTKQVQGRVYDAQHGANAGIAGATLTYVGPHGSKTAQADALGDFSFSLYLHDTDEIIITTMASGYEAAELQVAGSELWSQARLDIGLSPVGAGGHRVSGFVTRDPYCPHDLPVTIVLTSFSNGVERAVILTSSNEFAFESIPDGDYLLFARVDCELAYAAPAAVFVRGADVHQDIAFDGQCPPVISLEPDRGPPGTIVTLNGRCYFIHSGGQANIYFDGTLVTSVHAGTIGDYRAQARLPLGAAVGPHTFEVQTVSGMVIARGDFSVEADTTPPCVGDCDGDGQVEISELVTGVSMALRISGATCPALLTDDLGRVGIAELVAAVASSLEGCSDMATPPPTPTCGLHGCPHATVTLTAAPSSVTATPSPTPTPDLGSLELLMQNRAKWNALRAAHYRMIVRLNCYCRYPYLVSLEVRDDEVVSIRDVWTGAEVEQPEWRVYRTVDELFDLIEDALITHAYRVSVTYSPDTGAPVAVFIDYDRAAVDEEIGYQISELGIIARAPE